MLPIDFTCAAPWLQARRRRLAVVEEVRSFRAPLGEEMLHREHALLSLLPTPSPGDDKEKDGKGL